MYILCATLSARWTNLRDRSSVGLSLLIAWSSIELVPLTTINNGEMNSYLLQPKLAYESNFKVQCGRLREKDVFGI